MARLVTRSDQPGAKQRRINRGQCAVGVAPATTLSTRVAAEPSRMGPPVHGRCPDSIATFLLIRDVLGVPELLAAYALASTAQATARRAPCWRFVA